MRFRFLSTKRFAQISITTMDERLCTCGEVLMVKSR